MRPKQVLMFLVDGFDPGYVQPARMPRLAALMKARRVDARRPGGPARASRT